MSLTLSYEGTARTLATAGGTLRYHEVGYGPPLVLLHGLGPEAAGWLDFRDVLPAFAEFFRCLILDLPGVGASDALVRFVDALGLESIDILGNSTGGGVAVDYAIRYPNKVHRLVTVGGIGRRLFSSATLHGVQAPTLLTWGRDDRVTPLDTALATMRGFANAELHVFPNCGHRAMVERQEAFENVVLSFLLQRDAPEHPSGALASDRIRASGSSASAAVGCGWTAQPAVKYVMGQ